MLCITFLLSENALLDEDKVFHLVRPVEELDEIKSKRGSMKDKSMTKAIHEIYLTRLLSVKVGASRNCLANPQHWPVVEKT